MVVGDASWKRAFVVRFRVGGDWCTGRRMGGKLKVDRVSGLLKQPTRSQTVGVSVGGGLSQRKMDTRL